MALLKPLQPRRPALYVAAAAAPVIPCQLCANAAISHFPVTSFANRIAASFASPPVDNSITRGKSGTNAANPSASATTGSEIIELNK